MKRVNLNQDGQGLTEYIVLLMLVCVVSIGVVRGLGKAIHTQIKDASHDISTMKSSSMTD